MDAAQAEIGVIYIVIYIGLDFLQLAVPFGWSSHGFITKTKNTTNPNTPHICVISHLSTNLNFHNSDQIPTTLQCTPGAAKPLGGLQGGGSLPGRAPTDQGSAHGIHGTVEITISPGFLLLSKKRQKFKKSRKIRKNLKISIFRQLAIAPAL